MRIILNIVGVLMTLMGAIWFLQGINILPGSFMTGQIRWAVYGGGTEFAGWGLVVAANRCRQSVSPGHPVALEPGQLPWGRNTRADEPTKPTLMKNCIFDTSANVPSPCFRSCPPSTICAQRKTHQFCDWSPESDNSIRCTGN